MSEKLKGYLLMSPAIAMGVGSLGGMLWLMGLLAFLGYMAVMCVAMVFIFMFVLGLGKIGAL